MPSSKEKVTTKKNHQLNSREFYFANQNKQSQNVAIPNYKTNILILVVLAIYVLFNLLAAFIFMQIEKNPTEGKKHWLPKLKQEFLKNHTSCISIEELEEFLLKLDEAKSNGIETFQGNSTTYPELWTLHNAFVLSFTIASTIGYGIVTPVTTGGQIWAIIYAFISIPFTGLLAAKMGIVMAYYIKQTANRVLGLESKAKFAGLFFTLLFGLLFYIIVPSIILTFVSNEEKWTFVNCLYCVIITLTTIGFGDYVPDPSTDAGVGGSIVVLVWVVAGLAWFASIVQLIASQMNRQAKQLRKKVNVTNPGLIKHLHHGKRCGANKSGGNNCVEENCIEEENCAERKGNNLTRSKSLCTENQNNHTTSMEITRNCSCVKNENNSSSFKKEDETGNNHQLEAEIEINNDEMIGPGSFHAVVMANMMQKRKTFEKRLGYRNTL